MSDLGDDDLHRLLLEERRRLLERMAATEAEILMAAPHGHRNEQLEAVLLTMMELYGVHDLKREALGMLKS